MSNASNYPPGCRETDIPGCNTDDADRAEYAAICDEYGDENSEGGYQMWLAALKFGEH
jgi:hypothetical protein